MSGKRGNGEGSIYPVRDKNGRVKGYRGSYWVHTADGPKRRYISGRRREDVRDELANALSDRLGGLVFDAGAMTVGDYLDRWMKDVEGTVRESTHQRYGYAVGPHLKPALGKIKLKDLGPAQVRWFYRDRLDSGLAPASVHKLHVVLHKALKAAVADGLIPRNVTAGIKLPKLSREEIDPLSREESRCLLEAARGERLEALYVLALHTGMRQGEILALKWDNVDLEAGTLRVRRTLTKTGKVYAIGEPKTRNSRRVIRLTAAAVGALRTHLSRQLEEMERMGSLYQPGGLVFATEAGTIINPSNLRNRSLKPLLKAAGLRPVRFHDLRHTCATLLLSKNVNPKIVSEMLGHASVSITLDVYSHLMPDMQEKAAKALGEALG
ncbi:MAG: site-specific integrase [Rubrobacter sp.]|nr:site-specific integrase [Rubrobacter sp.]MDQ3375909.1 site-specific integrase [Actinomycetota bacterium]